MFESMRVAAVFAALVMAPTAFADLAEMPAGQYGLDKTHAYITMSYSHLGFSHPTIQFTDFDVSLNLDSAHPERSRLNVIIETDSMDSGVAELDAQLRGDNFFQADKHPQITFKATDIEMSSATTGKVTGDLTIRGIAKPVTLDVKLNNAAVHPMLKVPVLGFDASATVKRSDWGMTRAVPFVSDEIKIHISVELPKSQ